MEPQPPNLSLAQPYTTCMLFLHDFEGTEAYGWDIQRPLCKCLLLSSHQYDVPQASNSAKERRAPA